MKKFHILFVLFVLAVPGCESDTEKPAPSLTGEWSLTNVSGGLMGIDHDFAPGTVTWTFSDDTNTIDVVNNNTNESLESMLPTGTYPYSIIAGENAELCDQTL